MFKIFFIILAVFVFAFAVNGVSLAMMCGSHSGSHNQIAQTSTEHKHETKEVVEVDNKICPVSDEEINEKTKVTYEYEGKIYNLCCKACVKDFKKDPQKYIKKLKAMEEKEAEEHKGHEGHHH